MTHFDLVPVEVNGEGMFCRPIEWDEDPHEVEDCNVTAVEAACPTCAQTLRITMSEVSEKDDKLFIDCSDLMDKPEGCKMPYPVSVLEHPAHVIPNDIQKGLRGLDTKDEIDINKVIEKTEEKIQDDEIPFLDPIENKSFKIVAEKVSHNYG